MPQTYHLHRLEDVFRLQQMPKIAALVREEPPKNLLPEMLDINARAGA
jgi:hypothetical protein